MHSAINPCRRADELPVAYCSVYVSVNLANWLLSRHIQFCNCVHIMTGLNGDHCSLLWNWRSGDSFVSTWSHLLSLIMQITVYSVIFWRKQEWCLSVQNRLPQCQGFLFIWNKWILLFNMDAFNWSKVTFIMSQRISVFNECCSLNVQFPVSPKMLSSTTDVFNIWIINVYWAANQHIRMISEGSCDTEVWSNDAENSALYHRNTFIK